ncbi:MAG: glycosyl transferase [Candidatus Xenobia bacterium]
MGWASVKIVFLINNLAVGGAERLVQLLANRFSRWGHQIAIWTLEEGESAYELDADIKIERFRLSAPGTRWRNLFLMPQAWELRKRLQAHRPDVVMSLLLRPNLVRGLAMLGQSTRGNWASEHCRLEQEFPPEQPTGRLLKWLVRQTYSRAEGCIAVSQDAASCLVDWGLDPGKITVIPNPIDLEEIERLAGPPNPAPRRPRIAHMGRLVEGKDQATLLQAAAPVLERYDAELIVIGDGPSRPKLVRLSHELGVPDRVRFLGSQPNPFPYLRQSDIFALSSRSEGFGLALVEAMACRLAVVSTRSGSGPVSILEEGRHGVLVPPQDVESLRRALERFLREPQVRADYADRAFRRATAYDVGPIAREYGRVLRLAAPTS